MHGKAGLAAVLLPGDRLSIRAAPHPLQTLFRFSSRLSSTISVEPQPTQVKIAFFISRTPNMGTTPKSNAPTIANPLAGQYRSRYCGEISFTQL